MSSQEIARAIEVFARGCALAKSRTHPCIAEKIDGLWVFRDAPRKSQADYRREEWIGCATAKELDKIARKHTRGRFAICAIVPHGESDEKLRTDFKSLGYRLGTTEPLMVNPLKKIPKIPQPYPIERLRTIELAEKLARATRSKVPEAYLSRDSLIRQFVALNKGNPVGWVQSIAVGDEDAWVQSMYVQPKYRRRGIGKSLLVEMLKRDRAAGAKRSSLLASHTGAMLYPNVGYEQIATLYLYTPTRR